MKKCDRKSHNKKRPHARTSHALLDMSFCTHFRTHIARAEVRFYAHVRRNPTSDIMCGSRITDRSKNFKGWQILRKILLGRMKMHGRIMHYTSEVCNNINLLNRCWVVTHMCVKSHFRTCDVRAEVHAYGHIFDVRFGIALFHLFVQFSGPKMMERILSIILDIF